MSYSGAVPAVFIIGRVNYITTNEAAGELGVTRQRVLQLIQDGRLKAEKFGNVYIIERGALSNIEEKPMGRPPKQVTANTTASNGTTTAKTAKKRGKK